MFELLNFIKENNNWREVLVAEPFFLDIKEENDYALFKYNQIKSDFSSTIVQDARGIIIDIAAMEVVCYPFNKFFNYGEVHAATIDWNTARVLEKIDGSLIKLWFDKKQNMWRWSTNGTIDAAKAEIAPNLAGFKTFQDLISVAVENNNFYDLLDKDATHLFELVSPFNKVVINYPKIQLFYLGSKYNNNGIEFQSVVINFAKPKSYGITTLDECIETTKHFNADQEGFVVVDGQYNRVKIKSPAYLAAHRMINNGSVSLKRVVDLIMIHEEEEFLSYFEEYAETINKVKEAINTLKGNLGSNIAMARNDWKTLNGNRKEFAAKWAKTNYSAFCFSAIDNMEKTTEEFFNELTSEKVLNLLEKGKFLNV